MELLDRVLLWLAGRIARPARTADPAAPAKADPAGAGKAPPPEKAAPAGPSLNRMYTMGDHLHRQKDERVDVVFTNPARGIRRVIVDNAGRIRDFPGVDWQGRTPPVEPEAVAGVVRFRSDFEGCARGLRMLWQVQPDGYYWADEDGYGMTPDEEVTLCADIDETGRFTGPFRLYRIGRQNFAADGSIP